MKQSYAERTYFMKKHTVLLLSAAGIAVLLCGCQKKSGYSDFAKYVKLGDYKNLSVDRIVYTVTEEDVQNEIDGLLYSASETKEVTDRAAKDGDLVNIDYTGTISGEAFEGGSEEDCELEIGSGSFIEGFEEQLIGMKNGESKDITVTFPEPYDGELDGKEAVFAVTMNQIYEMTLPVFDDAFVKENTSYSTVAEYETGTLEELQRSNDEESNSMASYDALLAAMDNATIDGYPEELYNTTREELNASNQATAEMFGMEVSDLLGEDYDIDEATLEMVNEKLMVYAIADKENISVSEEDYQAYLDENLELYGYESQEEFEKDYPADSLKYDILYEKIMDFLTANTNFNDIADEEAVIDDEMLIDDDLSDDEILDLDIDEVEHLEQGAAEALPDEETDEE